MNRDTRMGNKVWYVIISLIASIISIIVFITGKNLPDYGKANDVSSDVRSSPTIPVAPSDTLSPTLTSTPVGEAGGMQWYLYPQPSPQPPERVPQHGFFFPTTHPEQVRIEVFPPRTKRISAIYHPLSSLQEIGFTIDVESVQGDMKLWLGVVKKAPLPIPSGRFFKVWQSQEETKVGIGQYYGVIGDWYPVQTEHFQGSMEIENSFLTFRVEGVPENPLSLPVSDEYALYLGYEAGENSSFSAIVNFAPRGAP